MDYQQDDTSTQHGRHMTTHTAERMEVFLGLAVTFDRKLWIHWIEILKEKSVRLEE